MRILFTCGGTAGHINPALGIAGRIKELLPDAEILFVGADGMMETQLVPKEGYEIKTVTITNLSRSLSPKAIAHNLKTVKNVLLSTSQAKKIIKEFRPDVAVGTGGYVCYSVLKAAKQLGVPTLVHESNAVPGLTTKLLSRVVDCVMVGFQSAVNNYPKAKKVVFTGTPVRTGFRAQSREYARRKLNIESETPFILSIWGSLGSDFMNDMMTQVIAIAARKSDIRLLHSAGKRGYAKMKQDLDRISPGFDKMGMEVRDYIYDMPMAMAAADLIICRSGASTLGELAALGKPAILIPSPNVTGAHQEKNARVLENAGAARVMTEGSFTPEALYKEIVSLSRDCDALQRMSVAMKATGVTNSTEIITDIVLGFIN